MSPLSWRRKANVVFVFILSGLLYFLVVSKEHYINAENEFLMALKGPLNEYDLMLIEYVRTKVLVPPSIKPYENLLGTTRFKDNLSQEFYAKYIKKLFNNKRQGFFVEAGALDGEDMSNTLWLEKHRHWTGLLVEPDPISYKRLTSKNRKAWLANVCFSVNSFPKMELMTHSNYPTYQAIMNELNRDKAMASIVSIKEHTNTKTSFSSYYYSQCFPVNTMLAALNVSAIDLFSLDIEGVQKEVLQQIEFEKFDIKVLFVEWLDHAYFEWLLKYMESKGFTLLKNIMTDAIFVKNDSQYYKIVQEEIRTRKVIYYTFA